MANHYGTQILTHSTHFCHSHTNRAGGAALCESMPVCGPAEEQFTHCWEGHAAAGYPQIISWSPPHCRPHIASHCLLSRIQSALRNPWPPWYVIYSVAIIMYISTIFFKKMWYLKKIYIQIFNDFQDGMLDSSQWDVKSCLVLGKRSPSYLWYEWRASNANPFFNPSQNQYFILSKCAL